MALHGSTALNRPQGIAIIGGGMVGASLALLLSRALPACRIQLFEASPLLNASEEKSPAEAAGLGTSSADNLSGGASWDGRSTALAPTSVELFTALGLWQQIAPFATAIERIHVSDQGSWGLSQFTRADNHQQPLGQVVENAGLQPVLHQALAQNPNIQVIAAAQVTRLQPVQSGMQVVWRADEQEQQCMSALVILADGADSPLRKTLGVAAREVPYEQTALVANVRTGLPHGGCAFERFCPDGPMALLPRGQSSQAQLAGLVWTFPRAQQELIAGLSDIELLERLQDAFGYRLGRFEAVGQRQFYPLRLVVAKEQVRSHLVLQGNAAHFLHPVAGQGFNLSLRDGLRLAQVLSEGAALGEQLGELKQLQRYAQAAEADQNRTIALSDGFNRIFSRKERSLRWGRDIGMLLLESVPAVRAAFIRQLSGRAQPVNLPWGADR